MSVGVLKARDPATGQWVNIGGPGPPGPPGPQGPPGVAGSANYVHQQLTPQATWVVTHPLGKYGSVEVVDSAGTVIVPDVHYDSLTQITITFGAAMSGRAFIN